MGEDLCNPPAVTMSRQQRAAGIHNMWIVEIGDRPGAPEMPEHYPVVLRKCLVDLDGDISGARRRSEPELQQTAAGSRYRARRRKRNRSPGKGKADSVGRVSLDRLVGPTVGSHVVE